MICEKCQRELTEELPVHCDKCGAAGCTDCLVALGTGPGVDGPDRLYLCDSHIPGRGDLITDVATYSRITQSQRTAVKP